MAMFINQPGENQPSLIEVHWLITQKGNGVGRGERGQGDGGDEGAKLVGRMEGFIGAGGVWPGEGMAEGGEGGRNGTAREMLHL